MADFYNNNSSVPKAVTDLYRPFSLPGLGPETRKDVLPIKELKDQLTQALSELESVMPEMEELLLSVLLLWHDHLEASHDISQRLHSSEGSYIHGIMHRREPDYWNSKYWFRQSGNHPKASALSEIAAETLCDIPWTPANPLGQRWESSKFVDLVDLALNQDRTEEALDCMQRLQALEFDTLVEHIWHRHY